MTVFLSTADNTMFPGERVIASDINCSKIASQIINSQMPLSPNIKYANEELLLLKHYQFKTSIWNKIIRSKDFENFNNDLYLYYLDNYLKDSYFLESAPSNIEQKIALITAISSKFNFGQAITLQDEILKLNAIKLRKLQKLLAKFNLSSKLTRENLQEFSSDFFFLLKGSPISIFDYFTKNKTVRMNERIFRVLEEEMLLNGLKKTLQQIPISQTSTPIEQLRIYIKRIIKHKYWRLLVIPYDLPIVNRMNISDDLLEKILLDGLDLHKSEVMEQLKRQNLIDHYDNFRKIYRPIAFGVGFYFYYGEEWSEEAQLKANEEARKKFMEEFNKLGKAINEGDSELKTIDQLKEKQFERVLKSFREKYNEEPTPEEYQELYDKIFN